MKHLTGHLGWRPPSGRPVVIIFMKMRAKGVSSETHYTEKSVSAPYNPSYCGTNSGDSTNSDGCCETPTSNNGNELSWKLPNQWVLRTKTGYQTKTSLATRRTCDAAEPGGDAHLFKRNPDIVIPRILANKARKRKQQKIAAFVKTAPRDCYRVATWNAQGLTIVEPLQKLKAMVRRARDFKWDIVMVTDVKSETVGYIPIDDWIFVHGDSTGILLNPTVAHKWRKGGRKMAMGFRTTSCLCGELRIFSSVQPNLGKKRQNG